MTRHRLNETDFWPTLPQEIADIIFDHLGLRELRILCQASKALQEKVDRSLVWKKWCLEYGIVDGSSRTLDYRSKFLNLTTRLRCLNDELTTHELEQYERTVSGKKYKLREFDCDGEFFVAAGYPGYSLSKTKLFKWSVADRKLISTHNVNLTGGCIFTDLKLRDGLVAMVTVGGEKWKEATHKVHVWSVDDWELKLKIVPDTSMCFHTKVDLSVKHDLLLVMSDEQDGFEPAFYRIEIFRLSDGAELLYHVREENINTSVSFDMRLIFQPCCYDKTNTCNNRNGRKPDAESRGNSHVTDSAYFIAYRTCDQTFLFKISHADNSIIATKKYKLDEGSASGIEFYKDKLYVLGKGQRKVPGAENQLKFQVYDLEFGSLGRLKRACTSKPPYEFTVTSPSLSRDFYKANLMGVGLKFLVVGVGKYGSTKAKYEVYCLSDRSGHIEGNLMGAYIEDNSSELYSNAYYYFIGDQFWLDGLDGQNDKGPFIYRVCSNDSYEESSIECLEWNPR